MYIVELGQEGEEGYYKFGFSNYEEATRFAQTIIRQGYYVSMIYEEEE